MAATALFPRRERRYRPLVIAARWSALLAVPVLLLAGAAPAVASPPSYVALGDSYAAGPLIPTQHGTPAGCLRSTRNYPSLVASRTGASLTDVSCSGAKTDDLTAAQSVPLGSNPPQLNALTPDTALVTMTMGGNDIGFLTIVETCATVSPTKPFGAACKARYTAGGTDQLAARIAATAPKIDAAVAAIRSRSPQARIALVGYPSILPDTGPGCFPVVPFSAGDVAYLRGVEKGLNAMIADRAAAGGATFVDTYTPTIGHDACQLPGRKWVEGLVPTSPAAPVHPNALGEAAMATAVVATLGASPASAA